MGSVVDAFDGGDYNWAQLGADVVGVTAVVGGVLAAPFTGGASLYATAAGVGELTGTGIYQGLVKPGVKAANDAATKVNEDNATLIEQNASILELQKSANDAQTATHKLQYQADDSGQLGSIISSIKDDKMTLDQKLALIDAQVQAGLGTESLKAAEQARQVALDQNDMYGNNGAVAIQSRALASQILAQKANIREAQIQRDTNLSQGANAANAFGLGGQGVDKQMYVETAAANRQIQAGVRSAGWNLDANTADQSAFDNSLIQSMQSQTSNEQSFNNQVARNREALKGGVESLASGVDNLVQSYVNWTAGSKVQDAQFVAAGYQLQLQRDQNSYEKIQIQNQSNYALGSLSYAFQGASSGLQLGRATDVQNIKWWG